MRQMGNISLPSATVAPGKQAHGGDAVSGRPHPTPPTPILGLSFQVLGSVKSLLRDSVMVAIEPGWVGSRDAPL